MWSFFLTRNNYSFQCLHQLVESQVEQTPDAVAVVFEDTHLTYAELNRRANQLAHCLYREGVSGDTLVGIQLEPGIDPIIGMLAILKAGGTYVPLDLADSSSNGHSVSAVLTHSELTSEIELAVPIICMDKSGNSGYPDTNLDRAITSQHGVYGLDGVVVEHQAVTHRLAWLHSTLDISPEDVVLHKADLSSDSAVTELWLPLCHGGRVVIPSATDVQTPETLQSFMTHHQVTLIHLWSSEVLEWLNTSIAKLLEGLRWVLCRGEYFGHNSLQSTHLAAFSEQFVVGIKHYYSLPEAGGEITDGDWRREHESVHAPVGRPGRLAVYVLDGDQQLVPIGAPGEIYVGGVGLARENMSADKTSSYGFVEHLTFGQLLRTGERGRRHQDGHLELIESLHRHVWIKGRRIALGAIETVLLQSPSVAQAYVLARRGELAAYVVVVGPWAPQQLRAHVSSHLPLHQQPSHYVPVSSLPLTPQGTVDDAVLVQYPIIDDELIQQWEAHLQSLPAIEEAAVVAQPMVENDPPLHLLDLLPSELLIQPDSEPLSQPVDAAERNGRQSTSDTPALCEGPPLEWDSSLTLAMVLERTAQQHGETPITYIQPDGTTVQQTYAQLWCDAQAIMAGLRQLGLKPQDKVIFQLEDNQDFISAFWGCVLGGFIPAPISIPPSYDQDHSSLTKLHNVWQLLGQPLVLATTKSASMISEWSKNLSLDNFVVESLEDLQVFTSDSQVFQNSSEDLAMLLLTSGSTGKPKAVMLSHRNLLSMCAGTIKLNQFSNQDITLNWMPIDHVGALVFLSIMAVDLGSPQIHVPTKRILGNPLEWLDLIDQYQATISWAPNFAFSLITDRKEEIDNGHWNLSSMRFLVNAGEAIVTKTARHFLRLLSPHGLSSDAIHPAFGMCETCSGITWSNRFALETSSDVDNFVELGQPIPGASLRIVLESGNNHLTEKKRTTP